MSLESVGSWLVRSGVRLHKGDTGDGKEGEKAKLCTLKLSTLREAAKHFGLAEEVGVESAETCAGHLAVKMTEIMSAVVSEATASETLTRALKEGILLLQEGQENTYSKDQVEAATFVWGWFVLTCLAVCPINEEEPEAAAQHLQLDEDLRLLMQNTAGDLLTETCGAIKLPSCLSHIEQVTASESTTQDQSKGYRGSICFESVGRRSICTDRNDAEIHKRKQPNPSKLRRDSLRACIEISSSTCRPKERLSTTSSARVQLRRPPKSGGSGSKATPVGALRRGRPLVADNSSRAGGRNKSFRSLTVSPPRKFNTPKGRTSEAEETNKSAVYGRPLHQTAACSTNEQKLRNDNIQLSQEVQKLEDKMNGLEELVKKKDEETKRLQESVDICRSKLAQQHVEDLAAEERTIIAQREVNELTLEIERVKQQLLEKQGEVDSMLEGKSISEVLAVREQKDREILHLAGEVDALLSKNAEIESSSAAALQSSSDALHSVTKQKETLTAKVSNLEEQLRCELSKMSSLTNENTVMKETLSQHQRRIDDLQKYNRELNDELVSVKESYFEKNEDMCGSVAISQDLRIIQLEEENEDLKRKVDSLGQLLDEAEAKRKTEWESIESIREENKSLNHLDAKIEALEEALQDEENRARNLMERNTQLGEQLNEQRRLVAQREEALATTNELIKTSSRLDGQRKEHFVKELKEAKEQLEVLQRDLEVSLLREERLQESEDTLTTSLNAAKAAVLKSDSTISELEAKTVDLEGFLSQKTLEIERLEAEKNKVLEKVQNLQSQHNEDMTDLRHRLDLATQAKLDAEKKVSRVEISLRSLQQSQRENNATNEEDKLTRKIRETEITKLRNDNKKLLDETQSLMSKIRTLEKECTALKTTNDSIQQRNEQQRNVDRQRIQILEAHVRKDKKNSLTFGDKTLHAAFDENAIKSGFEEEIRLLQKDISRLQSDRSRLEEIHLKARRDTVDTLAIVQSRLEKHDQGGLTGWETTFAGNLCETSYLIALKERERVTLKLRELEKRQNEKLPAYRALKADAQRLINQSERLAADNSQLALRLSEALGTIESFSESKKTEPNSKMTTERSTSPLQFPQKTESPTDPSSKEPVRTPTETCSRHPHLPRSEGFDVGGLLLSDTPRPVEPCTPPGRLSQPPAAATERTAAAAEEGSRSHHGGQSSRRYAARRGSPHPLLLRRKMMQQATVISDESSD